MGLRKIILLFFVFCFAAAHADTIEFKGRFTLLSGNMPPVVELHAYSEDMNGSSAVSDSSFSLKIPIAAPTEYNLRFGRSSYEIMLTPKEKLTTIVIKLDNDQVKDIQIDHSNENEAFRIFTSTVNMYEEKLRTHFIKCEKEEDCQKDLHDLLSDYRDELESIQKKHPGSYTAETLCKMKMPAIAKDIKNTAAEFRANYFANVAFGDTGILLNGVYKDMVGNYVDYLIEPKYSKEEIFINDLLTKAGANRRVLSKTANALFEALYSKSREKMLGMFITWFNANKAAVNSPVLDMKVSKLSKVMPGQPFLDIERKDSSGVMQSLKDLVTKSKCTLLIFWSSECSHCREELPYVKEVYDKYKSKGLNIYAVSSDMSRKKWLAFIKEKNLAWTNVQNIEGSPMDNPSMNYGVIFTPTLVLIDHNGVILHRFTPKNKLEKYLDEALK